LTCFASVAQRYCIEGQSGPRKVYQKRHAACCMPAQQCGLACRLELVDQREAWTATQVIRIARQDDIELDSARKPGVSSPIAGNAGFQITPARARRSAAR
jgi:hypothetical protein